MEAPLVSVGVAAFNCARFIEDAIASTLAQDLRQIEVIVVDDASEDDTADRARRMAERDGRVRVESLARRGGPAAARNRALETARGEWFAVFDGDDLMHPSRLARLADRARADGADIAADDLLVFQDADPSKTRRFLTGRRARGPTWVGAEAFLRETRLYSRHANLGYLKPLVRLESWRAAGVRYDESLAIGEDHDLMLRLLLAGLKCRIDPFLGYFYRRHADSTSHRLSERALAALARQDARRRAAALPGASPSLRRALGGLTGSIATAGAFGDAVSALKARKPGKALAILARRPQSALLFRMPLAAAAGRVLRRLSPKPSATEPRASEVWFITRQRVVGRTNGSSTYLLDLAQAVRRAGLEPHLLQPSPAVVGRWPLLKLKPEMEVFASIGWRGLWRAGPFVFARDPKVYLAAARGAFAFALACLGLPCAWLKASQAPFSPAAPWTDADRIFVARMLRRRAGVIIADYAWQTEAFAYALRPDARTAVVMHDLFHRREQSPRAPRLIDAETELRLLGRAEMVIAIQKTEAEAVASRLAGRRTLVAPMTASPARAPQPGDPSRILFVGSNAPANVTGLTWMLDLAWPAIREALPAVELMVAGGVARAKPPAPEGVRYLGFVDRLEPLYADAGVVVSPLTDGSGLKIKLIEALAHGKACVATSITLQGVEEEAAHAVAVADTPEDFAFSVIELLLSEKRRIELGRRALAAVRASFTAERSQDEFVRWLAESGAVPG